MMGGSSTKKKAVGEKTSSRSKIVCTLVNFRKKPMSAPRQIVTIDSGSGRSWVCSMKWMSRMPSAMTQSTKKIDRELPSCKYYENILEFVKERKLRRGLTSCSFSDWTVVVVGCIVVVVDVVELVLVDIVVLLVVGSCVVLVLVFTVLDSVVLERVVVLVEAGVVAKVVAAVTFAVGWGGFRVVVVCSVVAGDVMGSTVVTLLDSSPIAMDKRETRKINLSSFIACRTNYAFCLMRNRRQQNILARFAKLLNRKKKWKFSLHSNFFSSLETWSSKLVYILWGSKIFYVVKSSWERRKIYRKKVCEILFFDDFTCSRRLRFLQFTEIRL